MHRGSGGRPRSPELSPSPGDLFCSWEEDRKLVLRGWSLVFISLATLLVFSMVDGQMAYVHGPYTGFIGLWIDCRRHKCANAGQVTGQSHRPWVLLMGQESLWGSSLGLMWERRCCWRVTLSGSRVVLEFPGSDFGDVSGGSDFSFSFFGGAEARTQGLAHTPQGFYY